MINLNKVWAVKDKTICQENLTLSLGTLLTLPDPVFKWVTSRDQAVGIHTIDLRKPIFTKNLNYEFLYTFIDKLDSSKAGSIKIIDDEQEIIEKIEKLWDSNNFFSNPSSFYTLLTTVANIENFDVNGPFRKAVAAYNFLLNTNEKFKSQADFSDRITEECKNSKNLETLIKLNIERKTAILAEQASINGILRPTQAVFASQIIGTTYEWKVDDVKVLISQQHSIGNTTILTEKPACCRFPEGNCVVNIVSDRYAHSYSEYTVAFTTGRCSDCARQHAPIVSLEDIEDYIRSWLLIPKNAIFRSEESNKVYVRLSKDAINVLFSKVQPCSNTYLKPNKPLHWTIEYLSSSVVKFTTPKPFETITFEIPEQSASLSVLFRSANFADLCSCLGLIPAMLKTAEAKFNALVPKLLSIYQTLEPVINKFLLTNKLGRSEIVPNELALYEGLTSTNKISFKESVVFKFKVNTANTPYPNCNIDLNSPESFAQACFNILFEKNLVYVTDKERSNFILNTLIYEMMQIYIDLRRVSNNFIRWSSEKNTLPVDMEEYIKNYVLGGSRPSLPLCMTLSFRK